MEEETPYILLPHIVVTAHRRTLAENTKQSLNGLLSKGEEIARSDLLEPRRLFCFKLVFKAMALFAGKVLAKRKEFNEKEGELIQENFKMFEDPSELSSMSGDSSKHWWGLTNIKGKEHKNLFFDFIMKIVFISKISCDSIVNVNFTLSMW
ncbi:MAG: hypothetical protein Ta2E_09690 [Mycoplasmoidaceae bacterium]|nr:MAG: hypothetical protein Ta2E_09690 [Mycoplasmoidaceae bacterium]